MNTFEDGNELASQPFKNFFFKLCNRLGIDSERAKKRVKELYKLDSFSDVTKYQLFQVVQKLKTLLAKEIIIDILTKNKGKTAEEQAEALIEKIKVEEKNDS